MRDISIAPIESNDQNQLEEMMDEEDGAYERRSEKRRLLGKYVYRLHCQCLKFSVCFVLFSPCELIIEVFCLRCVLKNSFIRSEVLWK